MPRVSRRSVRRSVRRGSRVRSARGSVRRGSRGRSARGSVRRGSRVRRSAKRVRVGGGDCDEMTNRIAKHDALRQSQDPNLREKVVDKFIEDTEIKKNLMGLINQFVTEAQSEATSDAFYCREPTTIRLLKTKFETLSNEMNVDMLLKNTLNML